MWAKCCFFRGGDIGIWLVCACLLFSCRVEKEEMPMRIAFISDAHVQDVVGHPELIRTMDVQMRSTRLFNENYFALLSALDDVVGKGIKLVVLPGDLTDDGQYVNQEAVRRVLTEYAGRHGLSFFVTTGNHDPLKPFGQEIIGRDFLREDGGTSVIASSASLLKDQPSDVSCSVDTLLRGAGYAEEMVCYRDFGYFPRSEYLYWESPFTSYDYESYDYKEAIRQSILERRYYTLCDSFPAIDASYLVEPVDGLWLLSIDGSVHVPFKGKEGEIRYAGSGDGYNNILSHKPFLVPWVKKIALEAEKRGKTLIAFSHYPLVDFTDGAAALIAKAWGEEKFDLRRVPSQEVTAAFRDAGIRIHFAGHMHVNDIGIWKGKDGKVLYNVQVPSIANFIPAYRILTLEGKDRFLIETVTLDSVKGFDRFFPLYRRELAYAEAQGTKSSWSEEALESTDYLTFCDWHFRDLTRLRFIPNEMPPIVRDSLVVMSGKVLWERLGGEISEGTDNWDSWTGYDLILDLYRLFYGGRLALKYIPVERMVCYSRLFRLAEERADSLKLSGRIREIGTIFDRFRKEDPADVRIDLALEAPIELSGKVH